MNRVSGQDVGNPFSAGIRQAAIAPRIVVSEPYVVQPHDLEDSGMHVADAIDVLNGC
jgi:hypothetical protein